MAQNPDSRKVTTVASSTEEGSALRAAALVADASRALWVEDAAAALPRIAELLVSEGLAVRAVVDIDDDGGGMRAEAPGGAAPESSSGMVSIPIVASQRTIGSISVDLPPHTGVTPAHVTAVLKHLAQFIGPAVVSQRARVSERARLVDENSRLRGRLHGRHDLTSIIGNSEAMRQVCELVARAATTGTPVLLEGEAGTGKEFLARTLHHSSPWARKPFVEYSCSRISGSSLEADLLEQLRGRDAGKKRPPLADGGTLFLDDVHELTAAAQGQLMRVLQQREFATGQASSPLHPQVRIVATAEISLDAAVSDGRFRADVFHRLSGFSIAVPRLRDRAADIQLLAEFFVARFACDHGKPAGRISPRALDMLTRYPWPGNVPGALQRHRTGGAAVRRRGGARPSPLARDPRGRRHRPRLAVQPVRVARRLREGSAARCLAGRPRRAQPRRPAPADHRSHLQLQGPQARHRLPPLQGSDPSP